VEVFEHVALQLGAAEGALGDLGLRRLLEAVAQAGAEDRARLAAERGPAGLAQAQGARLGLGVARFAQAGGRSASSRRPWSYCSSGSVG
jgi:hypothetical protein